MKNWVKWVPVGIALLVFSSIEAQPPGRPDRQRIAAALQLQPNQEARFFSAMDKTGMALKTLRAKQIADPEERRAELRKINEAHRKEIASILNKEQMDKWTEMRRERMRMRNQGSPRHGQFQRPPGSPGAMPNPELMKAVREYSQKEILPVLKKERAKLEKEMSPGDREILASLRTQMKARGRHPVHHRTMRGQDRPMGQEKIGPDGEIHQLVKKYGKDIHRIFAGLEPQVDRWNKDLSNIHNKFAPRPKGTEAMQRRRSLPSAMRLVEPRRFLLLDPRT